MGYKLPDHNLVCHTAQFSSLGRLDYQQSCGGSKPLALLLTEGFLHNSRLLEAAPSLFHKILALVDARMAPSASLPLSSPSSGVTTGMDDQKKTELTGSELGVYDICTWSTEDSSSQPSINSVFGQRETYHPHARVIIPATVSASSRIVIC